MSKKKQIVNVPTKYNEPKVIRVDIGCGKQKREGFFGIDIIPFEGVDKVMNAGKDKWPFKDGSVDEVHASHFVEHLEPMERVHFVNELYRVLKNPTYDNAGKMISGLATVIVPHWASQRAYGDLTHCFSDDTEILAESGWKKISDCVIGEKVMTLNLDTEESHYEEVVNIINEPYVGRMLNFKSECLDLMVTTNHDMVYRGKTNSSPSYYKKKGIPHPRPKLRKAAASTFEAMGGHHPRCGNSIINWVGENPERIRISEDENSLGRVLNGDFDSKDFMELFGWYVAEGHSCIYKGHYEIHIAQNKEANPEKYQQIVDLLNRMNIKHQQFWDRIKFHSKPLCNYFKKLGLHNEKYIPHELKKMSPYLLKTLIHAAIKGDGRKNGKGWEYATTSIILANDIQEVSLKAGYRTSLRVQKQAGVSREINGVACVGAYDINMVGIYEAKDLWYPKPEQVDYRGRMVCVTLKEHNNIFVRRNGKPIWSGNCWPAVSEFWFYYLDKDWRAINAPHNDFYTCNLAVTWGYSMHPEIQSRNAEYQQNAMKFWKEACSDIIAQMSKKV